jgi:hypothetical protein
MGFTKVPNPKFNVDVDDALASYAHQIVAGQDVQPTAFHEWLTYVAARA